MEENASRVPEELAREIGLVCTDDEQIALAMKFAERILDGAEVKLQHEIACADETRTWSSSDGLSSCTETREEYYAGQLWLKSERTEKTTKGVANMLYRAAYWWVELDPAADWD